MRANRRPFADRVLIVAREPESSPLRAFFKTPWKSMLPGGAQPATAVLLPETWRSSASAADGGVLRYQGRLSMTRHFGLWRQLAGKTPAEVHVVGHGELAQSADALAIAACLPSARVIYHGQSKPRDVTGIVGRLKPDVTQRCPTIRRLEASEGKRIFSDIARDYLGRFARNGYRVPERQNPQSEVLEHFSRTVGLAQDLMMRSPEISGNPWWAVCLTADDEIVESVDRTLAYARFLEKLPGVRSALEIGCGSGFMTLFLTAAGHYERLTGTDFSSARIRGAQVLAEISGFKADFRTMGAERLELPDKSYDMVFSCFVLEQCAEVLDRAIDECLRVARRFVVLFEPSVEAFPTIPGLIHVPMHGFPNGYIERFMRKGLAFSLIKPPLRHIYNPGVIHVVNVEGSMPPHVLCPELLSGVALNDA